MVPTPSPPGVRITPAVQPIQRPIHRQLTEHDDLFKPQQRITTLPLKRLRQVAGHYIGRRQAFTGVNQQVFRVEIRVNRLHRARGPAAGFDVFGVEVIVEGVGLMGATFGAKPKGNFR
ncbi:hypothetical protein UB23_11520 [Pseudomonas sp. ES3-33]|nr:hypothetical protein UB23_11520 [Pseudomonas sp. ES3-33]